MAKQGRGSEQAMIRLPDGMRDRLKSEAEKSGRSMNAEIVDRLERSFRALVELDEDLLGRIEAYAQRQGRSVSEEILRLLEREYPHQWPIQDSLDELGQMLSMLKGAASSGEDPLYQFAEKLRETFEGITTGQITGVNPALRRQLAGAWQHHKDIEAEKAYEAEVDAMSGLDEEEIASMHRFGNTAKFAEPLPKEPEPLRDTIYLMNILPPQALADLTEKLAEADLDGAAEVVRNMPREEIEMMIAFDKLPLAEQYRRRGEEPPMLDGTDPFLKG